MVECFDWLVKTLCAVNNIITISISPQDENKPNYHPPLNHSAQETKRLALCRPGTFLLLATWASQAAIGLRTMQLPEYGFAKKVTRPSLLNKMPGSCTVSSEKSQHPWFTLFSTLRAPPIMDLLTAFLSVTAIALAPTTSGSSPCTAYRSTMHKGRSHRSRHNDIHSTLPGIWPRSSARAPLLPARWPCGS